MIKDIVVNLPVGSKRDVVTDFSVAFAATFEAHLAAIAFVCKPVVPGSVFGGVVANLVEAARSQALTAADAAIDKFEQAARRQGLSAESHRCHTRLDEAAGRFGRIARRFDISIVAQPDPDTAELDGLVLEAALFQSGRPVLIVPYVQKEAFDLDHAIVCWDGSRAAARAAADAIPFLQRTKAVELVTVTSEASNTREIPSADMAHHLARHGLKVEVRQQVARDIDVPSALLSHAADVGTDLIVMGGYGHSRLREFVLGGSTRGILSSMTVPVLMSH